MTCPIGRRALLLAAVAVLPGASIRCAFAHALLDKSSRHGARRSPPPAAVRLWFNERLEPAFSSLDVVDAAGRPVTTDSARVSARDPKLLELALPALAPGAYTVRYKVLSVDSHTVKASFPFIVKGQ
jgi:methionine-rich copper-binding protein CopC